jgi:hypothetical protein
MKKFILFTSIIFAIAISSIIFSGCANTETTEELIDISKIQSQSIGEDISAGDIIWNITEVNDLGTRLESETGIDYLEAEEGKFIGIRFTVENVGSESKFIYDLNVVDSKGRKFPICLPGFAFFFPAEACALEEIVPGLERRLSASFDVALDSEGLLLEVTDLNTPAGEKTYIDLDI